MASLFKIQNENIKKQLPRSPSSRARSAALAGGRARRLQEIFEQ